MPCIKGQMKPMIKHKKVGKINSGNQRWIGRRTNEAFTLALDFLLKALPHFHKMTRLRGAKAPFSQNSTFASHRMADSFEGAGKAPAPYERCDG